ncbi:Granule-bound starch synthase 1, chloroplastic/amyloplastic [Cocos nucifera]|uniref:NDP-glucose--starch glucosyltransferase n=1 Tax=Cocos nucifera TaxID=13894 RepID=A0A8K0IGR7_COCNU|nr:Granule-bound starch synthase 1, chloroplastic/amyloplastic [Cocos nucifera]
MASSMAAVMASQFISNSSYDKNGGAFSSFATMFSSRGVASLNNQTSVYDGLRSLNKMDSLGLETKTRRTLMQARRKGFCHKNYRPWGVIICGIGMKLVFVATEVAPWSKTGGLGDVLGGLPPAMAANGHRVMTISPRYDQYKDAWDTGVLVELKVGDRIETVRLFHCYKRGVDRVFVDHPLFLEKVWGKTGGKLYGPSTGIDYEENQLRFCLLCLAALEAPRVLNLNNSKYFSGLYGEDVVFIANDWHTALLPCYLKSIHKPNGIYKSAKVAFCIHNIAYQGRFAFPDFELLNLPDHFMPSFDFIDGYDKPVKGRKINWMKAGILESDCILTVSPYYAAELLSGPAKGVELDGILRKTGIIGIVNGMDVQEWNPATDKYISVNYDATTGTGKQKMEHQLEQLEVKYPNKARGIAKFNVPLAHMMLAGADFIIIPSRFEPCGLIQMQGMQDGTLPICASTGGLVDTVKEGVTGFHMGAFSVKCDAVDPVDAAAVASTVKRALKVYGTPAFHEMVQNCMAQDLSWKGPAKKWEEVLLSLGAAGSEPGIDGEEIAPLAEENVATP